MAANDKTITINVRAITDQLIGPMRSGEQAVKHFGDTSEDTLAQVESSTEKISRLWRSAFEAFLGFEAVKALRDLATGADEAGAQLAAAAITAKNFGHNLDPAGMERWLQAFAKSAQGGGYAIDEMRSAVQQFASVGADGAQIQRALADTANLAAAKNISFAEAANIVRYALTGHVEMLTRYGIISREAAKGITTVEQAMDALEHATSGAAADRANRLAGTFGRLATAASLLRDKVGSALIPFFETVAKAMTALADIVSSIPQPVLNVAAAFAAFATSAVAITLVLPAIWKGLQIVWQAFNLLLIPARAIGSFFIGPLIGAFAEVITWLGGLGTALGAGTVAEWAFAAPIPSMIAALAALGGAIYLLITHLDTLEKAWSNTLNVMGSTFMSWVHTVGNGFKQLGAGIVELAGADSIGELKKGWKDFAHGLDVAMNTSWDPGKHGLGAAFAKDWNKNVSWAVGFAKGEFNKFFGWLGAKIPSIKIPGEAFTGDIPGKSGDKNAAEKAAENAFKNLDEAVKNWLAGFVAKVDEAKAKVDIAGEKLADFDVNHPGNEPMSAGDQAQRERLVADQLREQGNLRTALLANENAENLAATKYREIAEKISGHLKNHDELVRQALNAAREHAKAAQDLYLNYLKAGTELDRIIKAEQAAKEQQSNEHYQSMIDANDMAFDQTKTAAAAVQESIEQAIAMAQMGGGGGIAFQGAPETSRERDFRQQATRETTTHGREPANIAEDRLKIALDELTLSVAQADQETKQKNRDDAEARYNAYKTQENLNGLNAAQQALTQSTLDVAKANDQLMQAQRKLTLDIAQQWNQLMQGLIQKVGMPGLSGAGSNTSPLSFNPMTFLFAAFEQTQAFADVMNTATQIVQTLTQAFEALRPIIDAVMMVVRAVVNVFIFLYNAVARILDLFGLQIQQLQYLTDAMSGLVPLISIVHEIPTLNELAAGRLNSPLSTTPQGYNSIGQSQGGQNTLMRVVEILTGILMAVVIEKVLSGMSLSTALQQTAHLIGINVGTHATIPGAIGTTGAKSDSLATTLGAKQSALMQAVGAKAAGLTITTNSLLTTIETTLQAILVAVQSGSLGGGGLLSGLFSGSGLLGGIAVGAGKALAGGGFGTMGSAAKGISDALGGATRALRDHAAAIRDSIMALRDLSTAANYATRAMYAFPGGGSSSEISTMLGLDTDRRMNMSGKNLGRVGL